MKVISESVIKSNTGKAFPVRKGQIIRVIGRVHGRLCRI